MYIPSEQSMSAVVLRPAKPEDAPGIAACVCEAYVHYIERIGYVEYDHRVINGYPRVFFRKALP
jgi:hypothetical protein